MNVREKVQEVVDIHWLKLPDVVEMVFGEGYSDANYNSVQRAVTYLSKQGILIKVRTGNGVKIRKNENKPLADIFREMPLWAQPIDQGWWIEGQSGSLAMVFDWQSPLPNPATGKYGPPLDTHHCAFTIRWQHSGLLDGDNWMLNIVDQDPRYRWHEIQDYIRLGILADKFVPAMRGSTPDDCAVALKRASPYIRQAREMRPESTSPWLYEIRGVPLDEGMRIAHSAKWIGGFSPSHRERKVGSLYGWGRMKRWSWKSICRLFNDALGSPSRILEMHRKGIPIDGLLQLNDKEVVKRYEQLHQRKAGTIAVHSQA